MKEFEIGDEVACYHRHFQEWLYGEYKGIDETGEFHIIELYESDYNMDRETYYAHDDEVRGADWV